MSWRMDVPEGWVAWSPGAPDLPALQATTTTGRAASALARRLRVAEKEAKVLPGEVQQVGMRLHPRSGQLSASMYLTQWARPTHHGKQRDARRHLTALQEQPKDSSRTYRHREASIEKVPAGQLVLRNEIWRLRRRVGWQVSLETTIFPAGSASMFELSMNSRFADLQPDLMAELSLMAHSFRLEGQA